MLVINENFTASKKLASDFIKAGTINFENSNNMTTVTQMTWRTQALSPDKQGGNKKQRIITVIFFQV